FYNLLHISLSHFHLSLYVFLHYLLSFPTRRSSDLVALFGPVIRLLTLKFPPKLLLLILISIFIISNIIAATAPNFEVLLLSRLLSASMHAPFFGVMMSLAMAISPPHKKTGAIALVNGGLVIAVMLGVPFGSYIGSVL